MKTVQVLFALAFVGATCVAAIDEYDYFYNYIQEHHTFHYTGNGLLSLYEKTLDQKAKKLHNLIKDWTPADCNGESYTSIYGSKLRESDQESPVLAKYIADCDQMREILCHLNNADWNDPKTVEYLKEERELPEEINVHVKENIDELADQVDEWDCSKLSAIQPRGRYSIFGKKLDSVKAVVDPILEQFYAYCYDRKKIYDDFLSVVRHFQGQYSEDYEIVYQLFHEFEQKNLIGLNRADYSAIEKVINDNYKPKQPKCSFFGGAKAALRRSACKNYYNYLSNYAESVINDKSGQGEYYISLFRDEKKFYKDVRAYIYCKKAVEACD